MQNIKAKRRAENYNLMPFLSTPNFIILMLNLFKLYKNLTGVKFFIGYDIGSLSSLKHKTTQY